MAEKNLFNKNGNDYQEILSQIHSDTSPVGIDAKHTHAVILRYLEEILEKIERIEKQLAGKS